MNDTMIGVDLAKNVFVLHGASMTGHVKFRKKLSRPRFRQFMAEQPSAVVVMEACGGARHRAREMIRFGHEVRLIAPRYVKPFVKRQKNDAADAEAIVVAAQRPEMRFVEPKSEEQQAKAVLFRARERLVHQRTDLVNAPRAVLYEFGLVVPQGIRHLTRIEEFIVEPNGDLPELVRDECRDLIDQVPDKSSRIETRTARLREMAKQNDEARRLQTMPGVGPLTALAIEAFAPDMANFKCGRDFAAWLGPRPAATLFRRQGAPRACFEAGPVRHWCPAHRSDRAPFRCVSEGRDFDPAAWGAERIPNATPKLRTW